VATHGRPRRRRLEMALIGSQSEWLLTSLQPRRTTGQACTTDRGHSVQARNAGRHLRTW
jgi:hypothetical protein